MPKTKISIIIPCFNEKPAIEHLKQRLVPCLDSLRREYDVDLLFIDDGSTDGTAEEIRTILGDLADKRIISHERNLGVGAAQKTGFAAATGEIICTMDSDCTYDPAHLVDMISLLGKHVDMVTGSPYHPDGAVEGVSAGRLFLSRSLSGLYNLVFGMQVHTYTSMFRVYRREVVKKLRLEANGFVIAAEILIKAVLAGYRLKEYPTVLKRRKYGSSKIKIVKTMKEHLSFIVRMRMKTMGNGKNMVLDEQLYSENRRSFH